MRDLWFGVVFAWFAFVLPLFAWARRRGYRRGAPEQKLDTRQLYARVMIGHWLLAVGLVLAFWRLGIPLGALGLTVPQWLPLVLVGLPIAIAIPISGWRANRTLADPAKRVKIRRRYGDFDLLVPMTDGDQRWWNALSVTAGVCEEITYRGFMGFYLSRWLGLYGAAVVGAVLFGFAHLYQGPKNALRTFAVGAGLWAVYLATGSIVPGMVLHALIDVRAGAILRRVFTEPAPIAA